MTSAGEKILKGLEDAVAYAQGDKSRGKATIYITLAISERDEGLRIRAMGEYAEIYLGGSDKSAVFSDLGPVIQRILSHNHGHDWLEEQPAQPSIEKPRSGADESAEQ